MFIFPIVFLGLSKWLRWSRICLQCRRPWFNPCIRKTSWRRKWQPTPVPLPGEFHRRKSLVGCSPRGCLLFRPFLLWGLFLLSHNFRFGLFFFLFFFSVSQGVKLGCICGLSFFLMLGIYHHKLLSQNCLCCIPYVLVCCVSIFVSLKIFLWLKRVWFQVSLPLLRLVLWPYLWSISRSVLCSPEKNVCSALVEWSVLYTSISPFGLRYSPLCSYWLSA